MGDEALLEGLEGSGSPSKSQEGLGWIGSYTRMAGRIGKSYRIAGKGRELGGPYRDPGGVGRTRIGQETLPEGQEGSVGPPEGP